MEIFGHETQLLSTPMVVTLGNLIIQISSHFYLKTISIASTAQGSFTASVEETS
jgi:hypothetical protein